MFTRHTGWQRSRGARGPRPCHISGAAKRVGIRVSTARTCTSRGSRRTTGVDAKARPRGDKWRPGGVRRAPGASPQGKAAGCPDRTRRVSERVLRSPSGRTRLKRPKCGFDSRRRSARGRRRVRPTSQNRKAIQAERRQSHCRSRPCSTSPALVLLPNHERRFYSERLTRRTEMGKTKIRPAHLALGAALVELCRLSRADPYVLLLLALCWF